VLQLNVSAKRLGEHFIRLSQGAWSIGQGLFDADDLMALRALAEEVTSAIHLVPWSKPTRVRQFWLFHALSFPQAGRLGYPADSLARFLVGGFTLSTSTSNFLEREGGMCRIGQLSV
jgi:hypothetical protein